MPALSVAVAHQLGQEEAARRLQQSAALLKNNFSGQFTDLQEDWDGHAVEFSFKSYGMTVRGQVAAEPSQVTVELDLPLMAMMFKGKIEEQIKEQLGKLLA